MAKKNEDKQTQPSFFPPVVAVLGHVDHGKTTLLDAIRKTNVAQKEHGGITQKIGASSIEIMHEGVKRRITFIDTPGHEAFSSMRSRGTKAADIGLLIVSIPDGVMPQTIESINLLQESHTPFIVVLTKADLPGINIEKIKGQLTKSSVMLEGLGGDVPVIEISAKTGKGVKELLDLIILVFDVANSKENKQLSSQNPLKAIVIESKLDSKAGPKATVVVKDGTLSVKDVLVSDENEGKIKTIIDDKGAHLNLITIGEAGEILGFEAVPRVGSLITRKGEKVSDEKKEEEQVQDKELSEQEGGLSLVIAADTQGSLEAITLMLPKGVYVIAKKTGDVTSSDVLLAKSSKAIVVGFNSKIRPDALTLARNEKVLVKNYTIIYELIDEIKDVVEGRKQALIEEILGEAKILASFPFEKTKVLGVKVLQGRVAKGDRIRLLRGEGIVGESNITSLRQGKEQTSKIQKGEEGGVILSPFLDFTIGDMLISLG